MMSAKTIGKQKASLKNLNIAQRLNTLKIIKYLEKVQTSNPSIKTPVLALICFGHYFKHICKESVG